MILKNTDNRYIIDVRNTQTIDGVTDVIRERNNGSYYEKGGKKYIMYKSEEEGVVTSSVIIVSDGAVTIKRNGSVKSNMTLDIMRKTASPYFTPYGVLSIDVKTEQIISDLDSDGGMLRLKYVLIIQGEKYYNDMIINVIGDKR